MTNSPTQLPLPHHMGTLRISSAGRGNQVELTVETTETVEHLLDYYDSFEEASRAAQHFRRCAELAYAEGFTLDLNTEEFRHPRGHAIALIEALASEETPLRFRDALRRMKVGQRSLRSSSEM